MMDSTCRDSVAGWGGAAPYRSHGCRASPGLEEERVGVGQWVANGTPATVAGQWRVWIANIPLCVLPLIYLRFLSFVYFPMS